MHEMSTMYWQQHQFPTAWEINQWLNQSLRNMQNNINYNIEWIKQSHIYNNELALFVTSNINVTYVSSQLIIDRPSSELSKQVCFVVFGSVLTLINFTHIIQRNQTSGRMPVKQPWMICVNRPHESNLNWWFKLYKA